MQQEKKHHILVFISAAPESLDPAKYDSAIHHVTFSSVNSNLVSQYKLGEHTPEIAQSWTTNRDYTEWVFKIKQNLTFSDGSAITPQIILNSWLRMAKIMKNRHSKSGFFENLEGYDEFSNASEDIKGLIATNDSLQIKLTKSMPKLLDKISFGLYAIVHPSQFDPQSGNWIAGKENLISSGPYEISEWTDKNLILHLRKNYPKNLVHNKPLDEIKFFWKRESYPNEQIDIVMGSELTSPHREGFTLQSAPPSSILFVRPLSWKNSKSFFYKKDFRINFRNKFYKNLETKGIKITRSFFPLIINDIKELHDPTLTQSPSLTLHDFKMIVPTYPEQPVANRVSDEIMNAILDTAQNFKIKTELKAISFGPLMDELLHQTATSTWDITRFTTGILASAPLDDVKFMFKSKEGILLPDETGEILKELDKDPVNLQKINELLWEQGLIWPVTHYSSGLWARPDLDFSQINLVLPPTSFQWIGWKD